MAICSPIEWLWTWFHLPQWSNFFCSWFNECIIANINPISRSKSRDRTTSYKELGNVLILITINNQLDAQFLLYNIFISILYMFRATLCSSSGESIVSIQHLVYVSLCRWPFGMQVGKFLPDLHTGRSPTQSDIYQMYWYNWLFWWWTRSCSKHVENQNKYIQKGLCVKLVIYRNYTEMHGHQNIKRWPHALASLRHQVRQYCSREFDSRYSYGCLLFLTCYHVFFVTTEGHI